MFFVLVLSGAAHAADPMSTLAKVSFLKAQAAEKTLVDVAEAQSGGAKTTDTSGDTKTTDTTETTEASRSESTEQPSQKITLQASPQGCWVKVGTQSVAVTVGKSGDTFTVRPAGAEAVIPLGIKEASWTWTPPTDVASWFLGYTNGTCRPR